VSVVTVDLVEITDENVRSVRALRLAPGQERFASTVDHSLEEADENPQGSYHARLGFVPRGVLDPNAEIILPLDLLR